VKRLVRAAGLAVLALGMVVGISGCGGGPELGAFRNVAIDVTLDSDGVAHVAMDFSFDFEGLAGHGPVLSLVRQQEYSKDWKRVYSYSNVTALSTSGAPADLAVDSEGDAFLIRIGDEDVDSVSGVQDYRVTFDAKGLVGAASGEGSGDQFAWDVLALGKGAQPFVGVTVSVSAPARADLATCLAGAPASNDACTGQSQGLRSVTFTHKRVEPGESLSVTTSYPLGTFPGAAMDLKRAGGPLWFLGFGRAPALWVALGLVIAVGGIAPAALRVRRTGRDQAYADQASSDARGAARSPRVRWQTRGTVLALLGLALVVAGFAVPVTGMVAPGAGLAMVGFTHLLLSEFAPPPPSQQPSRCSNVG
jgi:hypothetical protein